MTIFARAARAALLRPRAASPDMGEAPGPHEALAAVTATTSLVGGLRGDRELFQERAARAAIRPRGRIDVAPRRCPIDGESGC